MIMGLQLDMNKCDMSCWYSYTLAKDAAQFQMPYGATL